MVYLFITNFDVVYLVVGSSVLVLGSKIHILFSLEQVEVISQGLKLMHGQQNENSFPLSLKMGFTAEFVSPPFHLNVYMKIIK